MVTREDIVKEALTWIDTPYREMGRDKHGVDCVGVILVVYGGLGLISYEVPTYNQVPDGTFLTHFHYAGFTRKSPALMKIGDAVAFKMLDHACHCGIVTPKGVLHAYSTEKGVFEQGWTAIRRKSLVAVYNPPGFVD